MKNCIFQTRVFQDKTIKVVVSEQFTENISNWVENWVIQMIFDHSILLIVSVQNFAKTAILNRAFFSIQTFKLITYIFYFKLVISKAEMKESERILQCETTDPIILKLGPKRWKNQDWIFEVSFKKDIRICSIFIS